MFTVLQLAIKGRLVK